MAFPTLTPSSRNFSPGDYPIKRFRAQSGSETRILYGSKRTGMTMSLSYKNVTDANAELFLDDYDDQKGTYSTFVIPVETKGGWTGNADAISTAIAGNKWRYAGPPQVVQVKPGVSNVRVNLVGVL